MRKLLNIKKNYSLKILAHNLLNIILNILPKKFFKLILEYRFMSFGMEITNICNANCTFCAYRYQQKKKNVISQESFKTLIDEYSSHGGGPMTFTPTVGDPLVDPKIIDKIKYSRSKKNISDILLYTNGILLDKFGFTNVLNSGLTRLALSTYVGSKEGYIKYYQKDKYEQVTKNIIEICKKNKELNYPVLITLHLRVEKDRSLWENSEDYKNIIQFLDTRHIHYLTTYDSWSGKIKKEDLPEGCEMDEPIELAKKIKNGPCFELYRRVNIWPNLDVGACVCVDIEGEINLGNLKDQTLKEIWRGPKLKSYRENWTSGDLPNVCKNCTRYESVDDYIKKNKSTIFKEPIKRVINNFLRKN